MYNSIKISEFLHRKKEIVKIDPDAEYSLVTVKLHHKGVVLREKKKGSLLGSSMYEISKGQFILSGIDARNGAFGIVPDELDGAIITNDFWCFDVDEKKVKRDFFYWLSNTPLFLDACVKSSKGETQRIRLQKDLFFNFEFHFPPINMQEDFLQSIQKFDFGLSVLGSEQTYQSSYLSLLRQTILKEAIEGKLTAKWRDKHPDLISGDNHASKLLEKIKAERERLIKEGKSKKDKPLAPITDAEKPFDLPEGWVWCRLGDVAVHSLGKMLDKAKNRGTYRKYLRNLNVRWFTFDLSDLLEMRFREDEVEQYTARKGDLLICEGGYPGRAAIWDQKYDIYFQKAVHRVRFIVQGMNKYFLYFLFLSDMNRYLERYFTGAGIQHFTGKELHNFVFPLPPLAEQQAVVEQVDKLMTIIDELEKQVSERKDQSEMLMQSVLREAFAGNK